MFDRYTVRARRYLYLAGREAAGAGSPQIETRHLLRPLLLIEKALTRHLRAGSGTDAVLAVVTPDPKRSPSASVELPLSSDVERVLAHAMEEAKALSHRSIGTEHLLLGLLWEMDSDAGRFLRENGLDREEILRRMQGTGGIAPM